MFSFLSDDNARVKKQYPMEQAVYADYGLSGNYKDWYDLYLMSMCTHHILANSTFSWWGAWLNQRRDKIVVAPQKWMNVCDYKDIYPEGWITM